ncbi:PolC-type DNA polymerase III, partial [Aquiflexum sp.]|uniref:3'-5' exonuclease n=1 Tax=Aquiflexum sp. TaxID=1872584 RepID=UPI0035936FB7
MGWFDFLRKEKITKAGFVAEYEKLFEKKIPSMRPLDQLSFVVLDTETTGLDAKNDHILSFGAIKVKGYKMSVDTGMEIYLDAPKRNKEAVQIHEILYYNQVFPQADFVRELLAYIGSDIIVGHHIGFDLLMLEKTLKPYGFKKFQNPSIDTLHLSLRLEKGPNYDLNLGKPGEHSLDSLCQKYGISLDDRHTAA